MANLNQIQFYNSNLSSNEDTIHEYLDIEVINNNPDGVPKPVIFSNMKTNNIVDISNNYFLSVVKWSLSSCPLPVIIPDMFLAPTPSSVFSSNTNYFINIAHGDPNDLTSYTTVAQQVSFQPENQYIAQPKFVPMTQEQVFENPFYYIYNVDNFLNMVNTAIGGLLNVWKSANPGKFTSAIDPKFIWNTNKNCISLICDYSFVPKPTSIITPDFLQLVFSSNLYYLFNTFNFNQVRLPITYGSVNYALNLPYQYGFDSFTSSEEATMSEKLVYTQQTSSVVNWSPVDTIEFISSTIPIEPTQSGQPFYYGPDISNGINSSQNMNIVLTDFTFPLVTGTELTAGNLVYIPTSEYRLVDMIGNQPFAFLNLIVTWRDKLGFNHNLNLNQGGTARIKIMLRQKRFNVK